MLTIPKIMALIKCQESDRILDLNPLRIFDTSVELYINMTIYDYIQQWAQDVSVERGQP